MAVRPTLSSDRGRSFSVCLRSGRDFAANLSGMAGETKRPDLGGGPAFQFPCPTTARRFICQLVLSVIDKRFHLPELVDNFR